MGFNPVDLAFGNMEALRASNERLSAENAKLRELVRDMWFGLYCPTEPTDGCPQCPFNRDGECFFEQRMRELGMDAERGVDE